ncbi:MAG: nitroreductase [bacterium]|nr:nitroreductase [bacterium]
MLDTLALQHTLLNGAIVSLVVGIIIMGSLMFNSRLWLQDYPKQIRDKVPPLSPLEKRQRLIVGVLFMSILFGMVILEALQLRANDVSFGTAYLHIFIVLFMFNLFDALVLDLFILTFLKPKFAIPPGAEGMEYLIYDYRKQFTDFLKGMVFCAIASLPFAVIAIL